MPTNPPKNMTRVTPYLYYEDVASAVDWLVKAFGFRERMRMPGPGGKIMHAEVELADGVVIFCANPDWTASPNSGCAVERLRAPLPGAAKLPAGALR